MHLRINEIWYLLHEEAQTVSGGHMSHGLEKEAGVWGTRTEVGGRLFLIPRFVP